MKTINKLKIPILFIVFNRPDLTEKVFEEIRRAQPEVLYIACDGPRENNKCDVEKINKIRKITDQVNWKCEIKKIFRKENIGCKLAVSEAINWFFENEEMGIVLEDDCYPSQSFFLFCQEMLIKYKYDTRIWQISGTTFFPERISDKTVDYFFSRYGPIWGWASWRRAWKYYDVNLMLWNEMKKKNLFNNIYSNKNERTIKFHLGDLIFNQKIDTWDYQWGFIKNYNYGLTIIPVKNQVINIGFGADATHTKFKPGKEIPNSVFEINFPLKHPLFIYRDKYHEKKYAEYNFKKNNIIKSISLKLIRLLENK